MGKKKIQPNYRRRVLRLPSTAYKNSNLYRHDPLSRVLNMELLQFYYSVSSDKGSR
jgi:hypothetical protein